MSTLPPFRGHAKARLRCELHGLYLIFRFHDNNNHIRKAVTIFFIAIWGIVTAAITVFPETTIAPPFYGAFTGIVFLIMGRLWNLELNNVTMSAITPEESDEDQ